MKRLNERAFSLLLSPRAPGKDRAAQSGLLSAEAGALRPEGLVCLPCLRASPTRRAATGADGLGRPALAPSAVDGLVRDCWAQAHFPAPHMRSRRRLIFVHSDP